MFSKNYNKRNAIKYKHTFKASIIFIFCLLRNYIKYSTIKDCISAEFVHSTIVYFG